MPWIAFIDKDVTPTAKKGLYVVYLYAADLSTVFLSMNQGATEHLVLAEAAGLRGRKAERAATAEIAQETAQIRNALAPEDIGDLDEAIGLGAGGYFLPEAYEAGSIAARAYPTAALPANDQLAADLQRFAVLYANCVDIKERLRADDPSAVRTPARALRRRPPIDAPPVFRPKDAGDYLAKVGAQEQRRTRRHESLIDAFGRAVEANGHVPATNVHPRDLVVSGAGREWLVEGEIVRRNAEHAVREAIGQLFAYRHFYYRATDRTDPDLVALFDAPVGDALIELLQSLGIEAVWRDRDTWRATGHARGLLAGT